MSTLQTKAAMDRRFSISLQSKLVVYHLTERKDRVIFQKKMKKLKIKRFIRTIAEGSRSVDLHSNSIFRVAVFKK